MARHAGPVLVDTNAILECFRVGAWRALAGGYGVETVEDCVTETQTGYQRRRPEQQIDARRASGIARGGPCRWGCGTRRGGGYARLTSRWTSANDPCGRTR